LKPTCSVAR